jgi:hypothetical protein
MKELLIIGQNFGAQKTLTRLGSGERLKGWKTGALQIADLERRHSLPEVTMVLVDDMDIGSWDELNSVADALAAKQDRSTTPSYLIFSFPHHGSQKLRLGKAVLNKFLRRFSDPERVQIRINPSVEGLREAVVAIGPTIDLFRSGSFERSTKKGPEPSMLDKMTKVLEATKDVRTSKGKLSAELLAALYGVTLAELARWLGRTKQSISKTPDADSLQNDLEYFERIARLRVGWSDEDFRKWLRMPSELLDGESPIGLIAKGKWQLVADFVADMVTGNPT